MTVVVAYKSTHANGGKKSVPVLIGDCVISVGGVRQAEKYKKIYRISQNLVLGFSGDVAEMKQFLTQLYKHFQVDIRSDICRQHIKKDDLTAYFHGLSYKSTQVIGWLYDCHCNKVFFVSYNYPGQPQLVIEDIDQLDAKRPKIIGTGAPTFRCINRFDQFKIRPSQGARNSPDAMPLIETMMRVGTPLLMEKAGLQFDEDCCWVNGTLDQTFGFAYEILWLRNGQFEYIKDVAYEVWSYNVERDTLTESSEVHYRYVQCGDHFSVLCEDTTDSHKEHELKSLYIPVSPQSKKDCRIYEITKYVPDYVVRMLKFEDSKFPSPFYVVVFQSSEEPFNSEHLKELYGGSHAS